MSKEEAHIKMKLKLMLPIVMMILFVVSASAIVDLSTGLYTYYDFESNSLASTTGNVMTFTNDGVAFASGFIGDGVDFEDSETDRIYTGDPFYNESLSTFTTNMWINAETTSGDVYLYHIAGTNGYYAIKIVSNQMVFRFREDGVGYVDGSYAFSDTSGWHMVTMVWNGATTDLYLDGVGLGNLSATTAMFGGSTGSNFGRNVGDTNNYYDGMVDEVAFYVDRAMDLENVLALYYEGNGCNPVDNPTGCVPEGTPTFTVATDLVANINVTDYPYYFNITGSNLAYSDNQFNCTMYMNTTANVTLYDIALNSSTAQYNLSYGFEQNAYDINVTCLNSNITASVERDNVFIDSVTPQINLLQPLANNTILFKGFDAEVTAQIFCNDPNLFSCNLTLASYNASGFLNGTLNNTFYENLTGGNQTATIIRSLLDLSVGQYAVIGESADSHTAKEIKPYKKEKIKDGYKIEDKIKITSPDMLKMDLIKTKDRYKFDMEFEKVNPDIFVECEGGVHYLPTSEYNGHLVCFAERKWIDFENDFDSPVIIEKINKNKVKVTPLGSKKSFQFKSIGDLNINKVTWNFNVSQNTFAFGMSIFDEDNPPANLVSEAEVEFNYYAGESPNITNYYADLSGSDTYAFNITTNESTIRGDLYIKYKSTNGFWHRYILVNTTFNTTTGYNFTLYNFNTTTDISDLKITSRQISNYQFYPDVIAKLQRRYTSEGVWRTVQMSQSGDFGVLFFNIREESTDYRIIFTDLNNNILKTTDSLKFICTDSICELTTLLDPYSATTTIANIAAYYIYDNSSNLVNFSWSDADGDTATVRMRSRQDTVTGALYTCDTTQIAASGFYSCNVTGRSGAMEITIIANGEIILNDWLDLTSTQLGDELDPKEGAFWSALIIMVCVTFGIFSPVGAVITMMIGLIAIYALGIFAPLTVTFLVIATVISIVIGFKVRT